MLRKKEEVSRLRIKYPAGTRIIVQRMVDPYHPVPGGTRGTVIHVDDAGQIHCKYDNGRSGVALVPGLDEFRAITEKEREEDGKGEC